MAEPFDLLETIKWTPGGGFFLLDRHLSRISESAKHFGYSCSIAGLHGALELAVAGATAPQRLRLLLAHDGQSRVERTPLDLGAAQAPARLGIAAAPVDPGNPFLFHKTTNRAVYTQARRPEFDDVVLWNPQRQITESTIANVVVRVDGRRVTPPVTCGLLAGTFRAHLLEAGDIQEAIVTLDELQAASDVWLINSVREWWPAELHR